jgi:hypothetical protein
MRCDPILHEFEQGTPLERARCDGTNTGDVAAGVHAAAGSTGL